MRRFRCWDFGVFRGFCAFFGPQLRCWGIWVVLGVRILVFLVSFGFGGDVVLVIECFGFWVCLGFCCFSGFFACGWVCGFGLGGYYGRQYLMFFGLGCFAYVCFGYLKCVLYV